MGTPWPRVLVLASLVLLLACSAPASPAPSAPPAAATAPLAVATPSAAQPEPAAPAAPVLEMRIPYQAIGIGGTPLWIAVDKGLFRRYGTEVTTDFVSLSPTLVASMLAGETTFAQAGQEAVISANLSGGDLVILGSGMERLVFSIYGLPGLERLADLRGKKIGITRLGATTEVIARYLLQQAGLQPDVDTAIVQMGGQVEILAGLQAGAIDAGVIAPPVTLRAQQAGFKELADMLDYDFPFYSSPLIARRAWVREHPRETLNVVRGYVAGVAAVHTDREAAVQAIGKYSHETDPEVVEESYRSLLKALPRVPIPRPEGLKAGMEQSAHPAARTTDPATFIDASFVQQLQSSGFIDSLYK